jgi:5-methylcytosine-specific restriction endonuclease McrA
MSRPNKSGLDYFPLWKPQGVTERKFNSGDVMIRQKALRNSSSGFIHRSDVREIVINAYDGKCAQCGSAKNLQIDHIVSVYRAAIGELPIEELNTRKNLQPLCTSCNLRKKP